jgi:hypothetical protein
MRFARLRKSVGPVVKVLGIILFCFLVFFGGVVAELMFRARSRVAIPVTTTGAPAAQVSAYAQPDFLWMGTMWWISIDTDVQVDVVLDGIWTAKVPAGSHRIYSNHDDDNTARYGPVTRSIVPKTITVQEAPQEILPEATGR